MIESAGFIPSEQRERTRQFEMALDFTYGAIDAVSQSGGYPTDELIDLQARINSLFLPNVTHGRISIPKEHSDTCSTPMLVVEGHEDYSLDESFIEQTPAQKRRALARAALRDGGTISQSDYEQIYRSLRQQPSSNRLPAMPYKNYGASHYRVFSVTENASGANISLSNRPLVRLRQNILKRSIAGSVMQHELTHVAQYDRLPFYNLETARDDQIRRELEAYHKQQEFNSALIASPDDSYLTNELLDYALDTSTRANLRHLNSPDDPYEPSDEVKRVAADNNYPL